jgi:hypothetical protein
MLEDVDRPVQFGDILFNGYELLRDVEIEVFSARDSEKLATAWLSVYPKILRVTRPEVSGGTGR